MKHIVVPFGWLVILAHCCVPSLMLPAELATSTSSLFSASGNCVFCHDQWGDALTDKSGNNVSITEDWRGTMMANSFKDPLWRAVMEKEIQLNPKLKSFIEDKCQTCHAPMARTQHHKDLGVPYPYAKAKRSKMAADGVSCTLCHQIQPDNLGHKESFTGHYVIKDERKIFGPYEDVFSMPMVHHVDYEPQFGKHVQDSSLCASCHTLYTPVLDEDLQVTGQFPEQVPYLEWKASDYAKSGKHCQDCHMPRLDEPIKISARPPWLDPREPFWRHQFVGGNTFMLQLMSDHEKAVQPQADKERLQVTIEKAREQLQRAAQLKVKGQRENQSLNLQVEVLNLSGHKFPTGHPYRRAWLHVVVKDQNEKVVFESGAVDASGRMNGPTTPYAAHMNKITHPEQVQIYESVMGDAQGQPTYGLLQAVSYLKDNRIPPKGFVAGPDMADIAVRGEAAQDLDFNRKGRGGDRVTYEIEMGQVAGEVAVTVELLYQSVPPEAVERLMKSKGKAARNFAKLYKKSDKTPETVKSVTNYF